jgi:hypothetical protein
MTGVAAAAATFFGSAELTTNPRSTAGLAFGTSEFSVSTSEWVQIVVPLDDNSNVNFSRLVPAAVDLWIAALTAALTSKWKPNALG